jgi:S-adenosylmethionine:tRNA-ribosyltransferase-isomerase (queuine synthetase)
MTCTPWMRDFVTKESMKRHKVTNRPLSSGDLILAVSSCAKTQEETVAAVADLLASGQVRLMNNGRKIRARVR